MAMNDEELKDLFSAFDDVSASDELKSETLANILAAAKAEDESKPTPDNVVQITSSSEARPTRPSRKARWRAMRVAILAACLALALGGGIAYAVPASYYEITQSGTTISLGVNVFGITVSATSNDDAGKELIGSAALCNVPYQTSLERALEQMEGTNPAEPIAFGPRGAEPELVRPQNAQAQKDGQGERADTPGQAQPEPNQGGDQRREEQPASQSAGQSAGQQAEPGSANSPGASDNRPSGASNDVGENGRGGTLGQQQSEDR